MTTTRRPSALPTFGPIARCQRCGRDIKHGRPYVQVEPGKFAHRGPCRVVGAG